MIETAVGIVLRTRPFRETSLIVEWLSQTSGRLATAARGARRPASPFAGQLDLFYEAEFGFYRGRRSELHTLHELRVLHPHPALRQDLARLRQAAYCAGLIVQTTEIETPLPKLYELLAGLLGWLDDHPARPRAVFAFELKLLRVLGLKPKFETSRLDRATRALATALLETDWAGLERLEATAAQARALRQYLHGYLIYHLGHLPPGRFAATGQPGDQAAPQRANRSSWTALPQ